MDSTSQALIYIRNKMGGGIMDYYQNRATEQKEALNIAQGKPAKKGARIPETRLTLSAREAMENHSQISCSPRQYPEIRQALIDIGTVSALQEKVRLDQEMGWGVQ
jgi:hypothetical protein